MQQYDLQENAYDIQIHTSHEKTADEMFEALGFKKYLNKYDNEHIWYRNSRTKSEIVFNLTFKSISNDYAIQLNELKAINQKCKEMGWLDE